MRSVRGNQWMFRIGHPADYPLRLRPELLAARRRPLPHPARSHAGAHGPDAQRLERHLLPRHGFPRGRAGAERLHRPRRARADGRHAAAARWRPTSASSTSRCCAWPASICRPRPRSPRLAEVFDFARDYLGLLKAAVIASGIVPPGMEGAGQPLADLLAQLTGTPGPRHRDRQPRERHPQGLAAGRLHQPAGLPDRGLHARHRPDPQRSPAALEEDDRRLVAARAILGEWLGGSGGGWQDSGGVWPGMKLIHGVLARGRRPGVRRQPRLPAAAPPRARRTTKSPPRRAGSCRTAWCWCTAAWRRTSARSSRW